MEPIDVGDVPFGTLRSSADAVSWRPSADAGLEFYPDTDMNAESRIGMLSLPPPYAEPELLDGPYTEEQLMGNEPIGRDPRIGMNSPFDDMAQGMYGPGPSSYEELNEGPPLLGMNATKEDPMASPPDMAEAMYGPDPMGSDRPKRRINKRSGNDALASLGLPPLSQDQMFRFGTRQRPYNVPDDADGPPMAMYGNMPMRELEDALGGFDSLDAIPPGFLDPEGPQMAMGGNMPMPEFEDAPGAGIQQSSRNSRYVSGAEALAQLGLPPLTQDQSYNGRVPIQARAPADWDPTNFGAVGAPYSGIRPLAPRPAMDDNMPMPGFEDAMVDSTHSTPSRQAS